ncbi:type II toxin-antitoxin system RelE/ParE family toxin [Halomonas almeriensis]|uniref:type II toxin-antitoxin system RelE/ParE family toxin n=1 Tax=Halomonas almeriensis TaxID=308163 RepID=UPI0025B30FC0|nr:type II toxin-antitoxin system RelE/ParE family toxin [Halomonas almeriensis]MDN3554308.1 type II toxin-antitoxin system RelE/ParE family toxin [Halomonas almeriensis]
MAHPTPDKHATKLQIQLTALDSATGPEDMNALHPLKGSLSGHWTITVNGHWRLTFTFDGKDAILVDCQDYRQEVA